MLNCIIDTFGANSSLNLIRHISMSIRIPQLVLLKKKKQFHHHHKYYLIVILDLRKVRLFVERYRLVARIVARHVAFSCRSINNVDKKRYSCWQMQEKMQKMTKEREVHRSWCTSPGRWERSHAACCPGRCRSRSGPGPPRSPGQVVVEVVYCLNLGKVVLIVLCN